MNLDAAKRALRQRMTELRVQASRQAPEAASSVADRFPLTAPFRVVAGTVPMRDELDPRPLMVALKARGATMALPRVVAKGQPLAFHVWDERPLVRSRFGVDEPAADSPLVRPELVLVPLLAFDRRGYRLGYGGGFYDVTLSHLRALGPVHAVGLAYAAQEVADVPHDERDQPLDAIVTENEVILVR